MNTLLPSDEIERKWRLRYEPDIKPYTVQHISQYYMYTSDDIEARIRCTDDDWTVTVKLGGGVRRSEYEFDILPPCSAQLAIILKLPMIMKKRMMYRVHKYTPVIDRYIFPDNIDSVVELEFTSIQAASAFVPFEWMGDEITNDAELRNQSIAAVNTDI